jgi:hypothetical protein
MNDRDNEVVRATGQSIKPAGIMLLTCFLYGLAFLVKPPVVEFVLSNHSILVLWRDRFIELWRWPLIAAGLLLMLTTWRLVSSVLPPVKHPKLTLPTGMALIHHLAPLGYLPLAGVVLLLGDRVWPEIVAAGWFLPVFVVSHIASRVFENVSSRQRHEEDAPHQREYARALVIGSTVFYAVVSMYLGFMTGEHVGDEGHYLLQARSMAKDFDLDLKNNIAEDPSVMTEEAADGRSAANEAGRRKVTDVAAWRERLHISPRSLHEHWYSRHPFGLPLLLIPGAWFGIPGRALILGLIAALGNLAMYRTSRRIGVDRTPALVFVMLFGTTLFWSVYSARALPEVLGATLLAWVFWAISSQNTCTWRATRVAGLCCAFLPFAHERFLVPSLAGAGFFGLFGLLVREDVRLKFRRLATLCGIVAGGYALYFLSHRLMFEGGAQYDLNRDFIAGLVGYPLGMWGAIADWRGVSAVMPSFLWLAAGAVMCMAGSRENRFHALAALTTFMAVLFTSCANLIYVGGSCLPGRYVLVVVPLLVPYAAWSFQRTSSIGRGWYMFLSMLSTMLLLLTALFLPVLGRGFIFPVQNLQNCHPILAGLLNPHATFLQIGTGGPQWATTIYVIGGILLTALLIGRRRQHRWAAIPLIMAIGIAAVAAHLTQHHPLPNHAAPDGLLPRYLSGAELRRASVTTTLSEPTPLASIARMTYRDFDRVNFKIGITTEDIGRRQYEGMICQPRLESNDWEGRGYGWTTLTDPRFDRPRSGWRLLHIEADVIGTIAPVLAVREGSRLLMECPVPVTNGVINHDFAFRCRGRSGSLYLLMRVASGNGSLRLRELYWSPFNEGLLNGTGILLPKTTTFAESFFHQASFIPATLTP